MAYFAHIVGVIMAFIVGAVATFTVHAPVAPAVPSATTTIAISALHPAAASTSAPAHTTTQAAPSKTSTSPWVRSFPKVPTLPKIPAPQEVPSSTPAITSTATSSASGSISPAPGSTQNELTTASTAIRAALVNIICYAPAGGPIHSISGSGVFIDPKGIILTNAHVAQYFLLADRGVECIIRTGGPATDRYHAALVYISPAWLHANPNVLTQAQPTGNGEYDFALLAVTGSATNAVLPAHFPFVPLAKTPVPTNAPVVVASYGAQFLQASQIQSGLYPTIVFGSIKQLFTYTTNSIDAFTLGGSAAAQEGSSGGGVVNASGVLVGTITTSTVSGDTASRSLDAITAPYIRAEYTRETGSTLDTLLATPPAVAVHAFAQDTAALEAVITVGLQ